MPSRHKGEAEV